MGCSLSGLNALYDAVNGGGDVWINKNRFRIIRQLGEGGFAYVYLVKEVLPDSSASSGLASNFTDASHLSDDGTYAMKKVLIQNTEQLQLVREEIRVSSLFSHPNLLPLLDHAIIAVKVWTYSRGRRRRRGSGRRRRGDGVDDDKGGVTVGVVEGDGVVVDGGGGGEAAGNTGEGGERICGWSCGWSGGWRRSCRRRQKKLSRRPTQEGSWKNEAYLLFPVHLDGTLLDNANAMKAKKEFFSTSNVLHIFQQLCSGLKHMHNFDPPYAHNDVKPGNVLITHRKGQPPLTILMDFGSARPARKQIRSRTEALQLQVVC
ncbi:hypothetical protein RHMOL_Rhmol08G0196000 [Rhododendron molle]|uniref:Uncharacterized protein n=1 Tax=Rhododendron molle TaxID=49168 RepID=A0ACC0MQE6_RHOML|nr:hypothetical protein RHMOL_Rhmol08G0196000 [Rhododendron molle]